MLFRSKIYVQDLLEVIPAKEQTSENNAAELSEKNTFERENEPMQTSGGLGNSTSEVLFSDDQSAENDAFESALCEKQTSELPESSSPEVPKSTPNKTEINNTEMSETDRIYPPYIPPFAPDIGEIDAMDSIDSYRRAIKANLDYDILLSDHPGDQELIDSYIELMAEICASKRPAVRISKEELPTEAVRSRFLGLTAEHIGYVLECMKKTTTSISII